MNTLLIKTAKEATRAVVLGVAVACLLTGLPAGAGSEPLSTSGALPHFDKTISRETLEYYLSRAITMEGLLNGRGDLEDNIRMLKSIGAKFIGRSLCLWGGEASVLANLERAKQQAPKLHAADPDMILQACIFEIVTTQVEQVPVPDWAFVALGQPVEKRNFRYADMLYPNGRFKDHWRAGQSVPDVSRMETKLWFYFLGASFIDVGCEAIHFGQTELMNGNDRNLDHYSQVLTLIRAYAAQHARRHLVLCDSHVPSGGLVRDGQLLMDFHSFPLRIMEVPDKPQEAILKVGFSDGIYGRSKGGTTFSGWKCDHLPYLVEIDNWGVSKQPGQAKAGSIWIWGYDEITWFAHQSQQYRSNWLAYARDWVRQTDPNGYLQMPGSRTLVSPLDRKRWYYANNPSPAVPEGFGDEEAIRALWAAETSGSAQPAGFLGVKGPRIVDGQGREIILRGMGLGGWILQEGYMLGIQKEGTQHSIKTRIADLIGKEDCDRFYQLWRENHMTRADVDLLANCGFNSIRLPMHYNLFTLPVEDEPVKGQNTWLTTGFNLTDKLLAWCKANRMYLILDLHAAPGGQGKDANISDYDPAKPSLWESEANRQKTVWLWRKLAERYANEPWIGGYDLLNEPNWTFEGKDKNGKEDSSNQPIWELYQAITKAIREVDTNHLVIVEGNGWGNNYNGFPGPWDNKMVMSFHKYWNPNTKEAIARFLALREKYEVPLWLGESGENNDQWFRDCVTLVEENHIGWAWWPHKKVNSSSCILTIPRPDEFKKVVDFWNGRGERPSRETAVKGLFELVENTKANNCRFNTNVAHALIPSGSAPQARTQPTPGSKFRVLALAEAGGNHVAFTAAAKPWLKKCGEENGFEVDFISGTAPISETYLADYQLVLQLDFVPYGWKPAAMKAFRDYIETGKGGWVGLHHATLLGDFDGQKMWPWFSDFLGQIKYQNYIPKFASATVRVEDKAHPCLKGVPESFVIPKEEWYAYDRSPRPNVRVLASVDESTYSPASDIKMGDHPVIWTNERVAARNLYIFMGHGPDLLENTPFTTLLRNAILWAAGK